MTASPLEIPETGIRYIEWDMELIRIRDSGYLESRMLETADFGTAYWRLSAGTDLLRSSAADTLDLFLNKASAGGQTFIAFDRYRKRPRAYGALPISLIKALGGAFNGDAVISSIASSVSISLSGLPAAFVINAGCLVEIRKSTLARSLHIVTADVTSSGGGTATIGLIPPLNTTVFTTSSTAHFEKPSCIMKLDNG